MESLNFQESERIATERNRTWENNQLAITKAIDSLVRKNERLPTQQEIANETGISRQTVCVHLMEYRRAQKEIDDLEQFNFMASKVLGKLMEKAMDGDMRASRLSLQVMGLLGRPQVKKGEENMR